MTAALILAAVVMTSAMPLSGLAAETVKTFHISVLSDIHVFDNSLYGDGYKALEMADLSMPLQSEAILRKALDQVRTTR